MTVLRVIVWCKNFTWETLLTPKMVPPARLPNTWDNVVGRSNYQWFNFFVKNNERMKVKSSCSTRTF